jgi:hypothetical protein
VFRSRWLCLSSEFILVWSLLVSSRRLLIACLILGVQAAPLRQLWLGCSGLLGNLFQAISPSAHVSILVRLLPFSLGSVGNLFSRSLLAAIFPVSASHLTYDLVGCWHLPLTSSLLSPPSELHELPRTFERVQQIRNMDIYALTRTLIQT